MIDDRSFRPESALDGSFERYLQDKGKGRGGDGGNYRRNASRELEVGTDLVDPDTDGEEQFETT